MTRPLSDLTDADHPAWPNIAEAFATAAAPCTVLPVDRDRAQTCLLALQVTVRSALGALAWNCGGVLVDHGWLRLLGGGSDRLDDLATANGTDGGVPSVIPGALLVGHDVLGGRFAVNDTAWPDHRGEVHYLAPETLRWQPLGLGHGAFVSWAASDRLAGFYQGLRWPGWEEEVRVVAPDEGIAFYPPLWSKESQDRAACTRAVVPLDELFALNDEWSRTLPESGSVRINTQP